MTSTDGINWTSQTQTEANQWSSITYGNGLFVAVSSNGSNPIMASRNGEEWTPLAAPESNSWWDIHYASGRFVAVSFDGTNSVMYADW
jgi:hypothetical protein